MQRTRKPKQSTSRDPSPLEQITAPREQDFASNPQKVSTFALNLFAYFESESLLQERILMVRFS